MKKSVLNKYRLFILGYIFFPFISFLFTLKHYNTKWFKNALWLFIIFFGFSMSFIETIDAFAYKDTFDNVANGYTNIHSVFDVFDSSKTGQIDFARNLINYVLTKFTSNYHILFAVYGLIFGFFYSRNVDFILQKIKPKAIKSILGLILFVACLIGFWNINGFRFWTATHIFLYGLIQFIFLYKKKKGIVLMLLSLAVHFSFIIPLILFAVVKYLPNFNKFFIIITIIFAIYNPLENLSMVESYLKQYSYNEQIDRKIDTYTSKDAVERNEASSMQSSPVKIGIRIFHTLFILGMAFILSSKKMDKREKSILKYAIILSLIGAILSFVPSMQRFLNVGLFFILFTVTYVLINHPALLIKKRKIISKLGYISTIILVPLHLWILFTFSFHTLLGNYFTVLVDDSEILYSLGDLLYNNLK